MRVITFASVLWQVLRSLANCVLPSSFLFILTISILNPCPSWSYLALALKYTSNCDY